MNSTDYLYTASNVKAWFIEHYGKIHAPNNYEVQTYCPNCGHEKFYFNVRKQVGFCHYVACHKSVTLKQLIDKVGLSPTKFQVEQKDKPAVVNVELPGESIIYFDMDKRQSMTKYPNVIEYLTNRGLTTFDISRFGLTFDGERVYVPIYEDGKLVNYVGRDLTGQAYLKYKYCEGVKTGDYLFGYDEVKQWDRVSLVENTFVSIWLRNEQFTTNFGSYLSAKQIEKLLKGLRKTVAILWDEGAEKSAEKACRRLHAAGIPSSYAIMKGQPDNHSKELISLISVNTHKAAKEGRLFYNPWEV